MMSKKNCIGKTCHKLAVSGALKMIALEFTFDMQE